MRIIAALLAGILMVGCSTTPDPPSDTKFLVEIRGKEPDLEKVPDETLIRQGKAACSLAEDGGRIALYESAYANTDNEAEYLELLLVYYGGILNYCPEFKDKVS